MNEIQIAVLAGAAAVVAFIVGLYNSYRSRDNWRYSSQFDRVRLTYHVEKSSQLNKRFLISMISGIKNGSITSMTDIKNVFAGVYSMNPDGPDARDSLSGLLREILVIVVSGDMSSLGKGFTDEDILPLKNMITSFVDSNERISPFAGLPAPERAILVDIEAFLRADDIESANRKLAELASRISSKEDALNEIDTMFQRVQRTNRWAVPVSIAGVLFTILFGIMAFL
jgi:hypothetical protein